MDKYEYAIEKTYPLPATEEQLNIMGNDGWELTGIITLQGNITETYVYYFKRRRRNTRNKLAEQRKLLNERHK